jgi:DNA-binding transcriptional LysR family regulator
LDPKFGVRIIQEFHVQGPGIPSIDQLKVFLTVVETGSFTAAARQMNRATSAISYAVANLELQLGVLLFDRERTRKPTLTEAGVALLSEARAISVGVDTLRAKVTGLLGGLEAEVSLVVDVMFPTERVVDALQAFEAEFPTVAMRLHVEAMGAVTHMVLSRTASIGVSGPEHRNRAGLEQIRVGAVELVPVAAPSHPLAQIELAPGVARNYAQLVLSDRSTLTQGHDFGVLAVRQWRLADLGAKHALLKAGIGWGSLPEFMIREDLAIGRLKRLELPDWNPGPYAMQAIYRSDTPPGPAGRWLIERFVSQIADPTG